MQIRDAECAVEALLFASGEPVSVASLSETLEIPLDAMKDIMNHMFQSYNGQKRGIMLLKSTAALEVLAIVAYNQPVTRGYISQIRGTDCGEIVEKLTEKGLICECGKLDAPGRPRLFKTTPDFLRVFGLSSLEDLPAVSAPSGNSEDSIEGQTDFAEVI